MPCGHDEHVCMCDECLCEACIRDLKELGPYDRTLAGAAGAAFVVR
jgi:hypothetical protein